MLEGYSAFCGVRHLGADLAVFALASWREHNAVAVAEEATVTPEMIEAGLNVFHQWERDDGAIFTAVPEVLLRQVYIAMEYARSAQSHCSITAD